jgi:hypothetical protein
MTDWMNLLCWYMFIINAMRSCSERTILHCVESYLCYIILVNKKNSEEWNVGENKLTIYIHFVHCQKYKIYEFLTSFSYLFRSEWKWIIYFPTIYIYMYCIYRGMSKAPKKLSNFLKRTETSVVLIVFECVLCEIRANKLISINAVTVSYRRSTWIRKLYLFLGTASHFI